MALLRQGTSLPEDTLERTAASLCRSLAPGTLADYIRYIRRCEAFMGAPFIHWVDLDDAGLLALVQAMLAAEFKGATITSHLAAVGTFAVWLNKPRPRSGLVSYLIKGESASGGPLPKVRVHAFPVVAAAAHLSAEVAAAGPHMTWLARCQVVLAMLCLLWPHRPSSLVSARASDCYMADGMYLFVAPEREKRKTTSALIRVKFPPDWAGFVSEFLAMGPKRPWLFGLGPEAPPVGLHT